MAITVVQASMNGSSFSGNFTASVTAGNTVLVGVATFAASNVAISSSSPTLGGFAVTGAAKLAEVQSAFTAGNTGYVAVWLLPNAPGGTKPYAVTVPNGTTGNSQTGLLAWEVSGLGASPVIDKLSTGSGASTSASSGTTGATTQAAEFVLGVIMGLDGLTGTPTSPAGYANLTISGSSGAASCGGYQIQSSAGSTYTYANANGGTNAWAAAVVTVSAAHAPAAARRKTFPPVASFVPSALGGR